MCDMSAELLVSFEARPVGVMFKVVWRVHMTRGKLSTSGGKRRPFDCSALSLTARDLYNRSEYGRSKKGSEKAEFQQERETRPRMEIEPRDVQDL